MTIIKRCWINQPSTLQPYHQWHGVNVLVAFNHEGYNAIAYFLSGPVSSMVVNCNPSPFSEGWK